MKENPRLTSREISEKLEYSLKRTSVILSRLLKNMEVKKDKPNEEEVNKIIQKNPNAIHGLWNLNVFIAEDE